MAGRVRIGISGWNYKPWRGIFYPPGLPQKKELHFAASQFSSIEINGTFYSLKRPSSFAHWVEQTPEDFVFAVKGSRYLTHMLRLRTIEQPLANLFASGLLRLVPKFGPMLWQFPPNFQFNPATAMLLESFFQLLPHNTDAAATLAARHDARMEGRAWTDAPPNRPLRHAIEIRHQSFTCSDFVALLRRYNVALVCADTVEWPRLMDVTADFCYCRLHGSEVLYTSGYSDADLDVWANRVASWARGGEVADGDHASPTPARKLSQRDVYVYFDNDVKVHAPDDAHRLHQRVERLLTS
ncbi:MAG TPA: DUF72 domain-containing protein [Acidobacteriaceae bacterium]